MRLAWLYPIRRPLNNKRILRLIIGYTWAREGSCRPDLFVKWCHAWQKKLCTLLSAAPSCFEELHLFPSRHSQLRHDLSYLRNYSFQAGNSWLCQMLLYVVLSMWIIPINTSKCPYHFYVLSFLLGMWCTRCGKCWFTVATVVSAATYYSCVAGVYMCMRVSGMDISIYKSCVINFKMLRYLSRSNVYFVETYKNMHPQLGL